MWAAAPSLVAAGVRFAGGLVAVAAFVFVALVATLWYFQRQLIFPRVAVNGPATIPLRRGHLVRVDVSKEGRPKGVPAAIVAAHFPPPPPTANDDAAANGERPWTLVFWHGNADQIGNVGDALGHELRRALRVGFLAVEYPGYALCPDGEPTERTLHWTARRAIEYAVSDLGVPKDRLCAFGQSIGTAVAARAAADGLAAKLVMLSPFTSIPDVCRAVFPFVPRPELFIADRFETTALADRLRDSKVPTLILHGTRDEIVPFEQGKRLAALIGGDRTTFVELPNAGHNDTFAPVPRLRFINEIDRFLKASF